MKTCFKSLLGSVLRIINRAKHSVENNIEKAVAIASWAFVALALLLIAAHAYQRDRLSHEIAEMRASQQLSPELQYVASELDRRCAEDCVLEATSYGYRCTEIGSGKVFRVAVN